MGGMRFRKLTATLICCSAFIMAGCDPGFSYQPVGATGKTAATASQEIDGVRFEARRYGTLTGSTNAIYAFHVVNKSDKNSDRISSTTGNRRALVKCRTFKSC
jgi:hypothetical protein